VTPVTTTVTAFPVYFVTDRIDFKNFIWVRVLNFDKRGGEDAVHMPTGF